MCSNLCLHNYYSKISFVRHKKKCARKPTNQENVRSTVTKKFGRLKFSWHPSNTKRIVAVQDADVHQAGDALSGTKMRIVDFVASASLRLCSSNLLKVSSFFGQGILEGSFNMPIQWETWHETLTLAELVRPKQLEMPIGAFLLRSVLRRRQETKTKSSWLAAPEYDANRVKTDYHSMSPTVRNGSVFGLSPIKCVQYASNGSTRWETDRWICLSQKGWPR